MEHDLAKTGQKFKGARKICKVKNQRKEKAMTQEQTVKRTINIANERNKVNNNNNNRKMRSKV